MDAFPITDAARDAEVGRIVGLLILAVISLLLACVNHRLPREDRWW